MASFKMLLQDLAHELEEVMSQRLSKEDVHKPEYDFFRPSMQETATKWCSSVMTQCGEVRDRHAAMTATEFNDDTVYRGLVTEMLEMKTHALVKMDWFLSSDSDSKTTLRVAFRNHMSEEE